MFNLLSQLVRVKLGACFGPGPFTLDTAIKTTIRGSFFQIDLSQGWGRVKENLRTKSINESSVTFSNLLDALKTEVVKTEV